MKLVRVDIKVRLKSMFVFKVNTKHGEQQIGRRTKVPNLLVKYLKKETDVFLVRQGTSSFPARNELVPS